MNRKVLLLAVLLPFTMLLANADDAALNEALRAGI